MVKLLTLMPIAVIMIAATALSQVPNRTPVFDPTRDGSPRAQLIYDQQMRQIEAERNSARFARLRQRSVNANPYSGLVYVGGYDPAISKEARNYILKSLPDSAKYLDLSKTSDSKLILLLPERECTAQVDINKRMDHYIRACPFNYLPGQARYFSFRQNNYSDRKYADIGFTGDWMFSFGIFNQGIFVDLGDEAIDKIRPDSTALTELRAVRHSPDIKTADSEFKRFEDGTVIDGKLYRNTAKIEIGRTYGFRVIAYKTDHKESNKTEKGQVSWPLIINDKRDDLIGVFRVIDRGPGGELVLLWRELGRTSAPKIKLPDDISEK